MPSSNNASFSMAGVGTGFSSEEGVSHLPSEVNLLEQSQNVGQMLVFLEGLLELHGIVFLSEAILGTGAMIPSDGCLDGIP